MAQTAAAFHDSSIRDHGRKNHEMTSAVMLRRERELDGWFQPSEIEIMADAIEDHRASSPRLPRTILGALLADADRLADADLAELVRRCWKFRQHSMPGASREDHLQDMSDHLVQKYGDHGYARYLLVVTAVLSGMIPDQIITRVGDIGELEATLELLEATHRV